MSWFNSSLNSLKGQITTFAQEVLAENPNPEEEPNVVEVLEVAQQKNEELSSLCAAKDTEIASLRKQISELLAKNLDNNGKSAKSTSAIDKNASLEDSWCWEPDNIPSESSSKNDHEQNSESSSGGGELIPIPLDSHSSHESDIIEKYQRFLDDRDARLKQLTSENSALYEKISKLTDENVELQSNLEELDNQHNAAMKEVLDLKNDWQNKWTLLNSHQKALTQEHELKVTTIEKDHEALQKKFESIQNAYAIYVQENEVLKLELANAKSEAAALENAKCLNVELIAGKNELEEKVEQLVKQINELEHQEAESSSRIVTDASKKCKDEDDFIVLQNEDSSIENYEQKYNSLLAEKDEMHVALETLQKKWDEKESTAKELADRVDSLTKEVESMTASQSVFTENDIEQYKIQISELQQTLSIQESKSSDIESKLKTENVNLQKQIIDLESSINKTNVKTNDDNTVNVDDLNEVILSYTKIESPSVHDKSSLETVFKSIGDKIWKVEILEKNLKELSDEVSRLKNEKATIDHQKTTLQADIEHYEVECAELMKNNEILLNELENYKKNKLETIPENNEEGIVMMEKQLDESNSYIRNLEDQYNETVEKLIHADEKRYELEDMIEGLQETNATLTNDIKSLKGQLDSLENEKSNLIFEINEMKTDDKKSAVEMEILEYKNKHAQLRADYERLSKEHSELQFNVNACNESELPVQPQTQSLQYKIESLTSEKLALENELQVLQSQIEHYQLKCSHLNDDNETLRKELDEIQTKHSKFIGVENVDELKQQLEEARNAARCIEDQFNEISHKQVEVELQNNHLRSELAAQQDNNTNLISELVVLKNQIDALETEKNSLVFEINELRTDDNKSEAIMKTKLLEYESNIVSLEVQLDRLSKDHSDLVAAMQTQKSSFTDNRKKYDQQISSLEKSLHDKEQQLKHINEKLTENNQLIANQMQEIDDLQKILHNKQTELTQKGETSTELDQLKQQVETLSQEKINLIATLTTKHNENTQYYMEIQRLSQLLQAETEKSTIAAKSDCENCRLLQSTIDQNAILYKEELEKVRDQINFLKEKSDILTTNLVSEQTNQRLLMHEKSELMDKNASLQRDLERLREHLVEMEEAHTNETLELQNSIDDTKTKMLSLQAEVSNSSNAYTSASIRATQHAETLQAQYLLVCQQRDEFAAKLSAAEDKESKNQAALINLQCALEQFQKEKETDIHSATIRLRKELQSEQEIQNELKFEISSMQTKLTEANQGLLAAARLSDQLETSQVTITTLKEEIVKQMHKIEGLESKLMKTQESQADKVEKNLVKSLLIGYIVSTNQNDKNQILKLITTVLDFNPTETDRVGLNKTQSGWLTGLLQGSSGQTGGDHSKDSLVQAFVNFLEKESQPRPSTANLPNLLNISHDNHSQPTRRLSQQSNSSNPSQSSVQPILLNENILEQFAPSRNSSSILKDILSDS